MAELAPHHTIGRRAILLAATGAATVAAGCSSRGEGPAMRSPRAVTSQPAVEVLSSDALVSKDGDHANLAALNTTAGLATGPTLDDPYGPFVQTALPKNHALLDSKPSETDARLYASESPDLWRARMRALAPVFVNTVVDGPELWFHDRTAIEAVVQQVFDADSRRRGEAPGQVTTDLFGEPSFANTDGARANGWEHPPRPQEAHGPYRRGSTGLGSDPGRRNAGPRAACPDCLSCHGGQGSL